ncbi:MAG: CDP-2,3-bis-(O-geranylgeranyl)-sn-glycerol synthase [Candidatus Woesearchaeota archaeon]
MILKLILQTLWLFLPALLANLTPPLMKKVNLLNKPIDFNLKFRGKRLLGDNKTIRGLVFGVIVGILIALLQSFLYQYDTFISDIHIFQWFSVIDYSGLGIFNIIFLGFLLGFGALFGDMVESFFKRQIGIKPGRPFFPFDQIDFLIGAIAFLTIIYMPSWQIIVTLLIIGILLHLLANLIGYLIGVNKRMI